MTKIHLFSLLLFASLIKPIGVQAETGNNIASHNSKEVILYCFWSRYYPHCIDAKSFVNNLVKTNPWLTIHDFDLVNTKDNQQNYLQMAKQLNQVANSVPAFIFCGQMMIGYDKADTTSQELKNKLKACHQQENNQHTQENKQEYFNIPGLGISRLVISIKPKLTEY